MRPVRLVDCAGLHTTSLTSTVRPTRALESSILVERTVDAERKEQNVLLKSPDHEEHYRADYKTTMI
jgi:hypothetical protein